MLNLLAQEALPYFQKEGGSNEAKMWAFGLIVFGFLIIFGLTKAPIRMRRPIVMISTLLAGIFYALPWIWPKPIGLTPDQVPFNQTEEIASHLANGQLYAGKVLQVVQNFLLFLGAYSVLSVHSKRILKQGKDWTFSIILLVSMLTMITAGYMEYNDRIANSSHADPTNWVGIQYFKDFLFDGMLQAMDAAMFSIIAFFILSAAYRAFRIRSAEATMLLAVALIVMLSMMAGVEYASGQMINAVTHNDPNHFVNNFSLTSIANWIRDVVQAGAIRALAWGISIGSLTMGLRLWLSLEKGGS